MIRGFHRALIIASLAASIAALLITAAPSEARPLDQTRAFYRLGDLAAKLRAEPSASHRELSRYSARVRVLTGKLDHVVDRRANKRRAQALALIRSTARERRDQVKDRYRENMEKIRSRYHRAMRRARDLPPARAHALILRAKERRADRKNQIFKTRARRLQDIRSDARGARRWTRAILADKKADERQTARVQKRELRYQLRALRYRS